jgi:SAM-dependent methyltransferase
MTGAPPNIYDRRAYRARQKRAAACNGETILADLAISALAERISIVNRRFENALDLGLRGTGFEDLSALAEEWTHAALTVPLQNAQKFKGQNFTAKNFTAKNFIVADEEALPFAEHSFDLIVSMLSLHAVNDLPGALVQIRRALKPDGLFLAAMFGGDTLSELRASFANAETKIRGGISPRVAPFADIRDLGGLLQRAGFALPVADVERTTLFYRDIGKLFLDLRSIGETNALAARARSPLTRELLGAVVSEYAQRFADADGRLPATFEIIFLAGWAPQESQQKPLKPGSAKMRLADALGTQELPTGEKPQ